MRNDENLPENSATQLIDEAEKLIWCFLDDRIEDADAKRLQQLLTENEQVRDRYIQCAEIHTNLYEHYRTATPSEVSSEVQSPVLGSLGNFLASPGNHVPLTD